MESRDDELVLRCRDGDAAAFAELARRHEPAIRRLICSRVRDGAAVDDLVQQTLLDAWVGVKRLADPARFGAWMRQIARNRCRDYYRAGARRIRPVSEATLRQHMDRFGSPRRELAGEDVIEALELSPARQRQAMRLFYMDGVSIAEIARRCGSPPGTIKRRLWEGREFLRNRLGLPRATQERRTNMSDTKAVQHDHPFPVVLPKLSITPLKDGPKAVEVQELLWFCIEPREGQAGAWATYGTDGKLCEANMLQVTGPGTVHGERCVEMAMRRWSSDAGLRPWVDLLYGRLTERSSQWLGVVDHDLRHGAEIYTFRDANFATDFGDMPRRYVDRGRVRTAGEGQVRCAGLKAKSGDFGWGAFEVRIGRRRFRCLRVLDVGDAINCPRYSVSEAFIDENGRTILCRTYAQSKKAAESSTRSLTVNGVAYHHTHDLLSGVALGGRKGPV